MQSLRVTFEVDDTELTLLVRRALLLGFVREDPHKAWGQRDKREAARFALKRLAKEALAAEAPAIYKIEESAGAGRTAHFTTEMELLRVDWIHAWTKDRDFKGFAVDRSAIPPLLMAYVGKKFYVVGRLDSAKALSFTEWAR